MELPIKQLKLNEELFVPLTVAEAVLVKESSLILTLDKVLNKKLESVTTPVGSGLTSYTQGKSVILTHSNKITPNNLPSSLNILYDSNGHIINAVPSLSLIMKVDEVQYIDYNGQTLEIINLGDDFKIDETNKISLKWKEL